MHDLGPATAELARVADLVTDDDLDRATPCEVVLHGWDLAVALGVPFTAADDDVEAIHGFVAVFEHADEQTRAGLFGPVVDADATGFDRVLALAGRDAARVPA